MMKRRREVATENSDKGAAVIRNQKATKRNDQKLHDQDTPTPTSSRITDLKKAEPKARKESRLNHEAHPINNDLILKNILEFSSVKDLKNIRLVSKRWRDLSLKAWRGKAVLRTERLFGESESIFDEDKDKAMEEFNENAKELLKIPFEHYDVDFKDSERSGLSTEVETSFKITKLELFSSSVRHLYLYCDDWDLMSFLFTKLPKLRTLNLHLTREAHELIGELRQVRYKVWSNS